MSNYLQPGHAAQLTIAASDKLATWSRAPYYVFKTLGFPNVPDQDASVYQGTGSNTTSAFTVATDITIQAGSAGLYYETGTGPVISERFNLQTTQATPGTLNATGALTAVLILGGVVTSTTAAAVVATLPTGAAMDIVIDLDADEGFFWSAIATGANAFTVTAATGHTVEGAGAVATGTSGRFLTRRTAADTWITYRIA